jgi:hypothetical protein
MSVHSLAQKTAFVLLAVGGPVLIFPDILPAPWRTAAVTVLSVAALALSVIVLNSWKGIRIGLWLFTGSVLASWIWIPAGDPVGTRHFAGIAVGVLAMASVAAWCTTTSRALGVAMVFAVASSGILVTAAMATTVNPLKFVGHTPLLPKSMFDRLPGFKLGLPGLERSGNVNPNAVGGTAVLLLPACGGLLAAATVLTGRRRRVAFAIGAIATIIAVAALAISLSRTAWLSALLTLIVWALAWRRGRRWVALAVLVAFTALTWGAVRWQETAPVAFHNATASTVATVHDRGALFRHALVRLSESPWLGIGISQFHDTPLLPQPTANAHNIFIQVALDVGLLGLCGYLLLMAAVMARAIRTARTANPLARVAAGAALSLVAVHIFGLGDAIALGAKVGLFQWLSVGLILGISRLAAAGHREPVHILSREDDSPDEAKPRLEHAG